MDSSYAKRTIEKIKVPSEALGEPRSVRVFLPPGYAGPSPQSRSNPAASPSEDVAGPAEQTYSVLYCQDGEQFFNFGRVATQAMKLILDEGVEPFMIVGVDVDLKRRTAEYAPEGEHFRAYCCFFAEELVPYMERHYAVRPGLENRVVAGDSRGGTVSLHLALDYPDHFRKVMSLSGAFLQSTRERLREEDRLVALEVYMLVGLDEQQVETTNGTFDFLEANRAAKSLLESKGARLRYLEKDGEHKWGFWQNGLPDALRHFFG